MRLLPVVRRLLRVFLLPAFLLFMLSVRAPAQAVPPMAHAADPAFEVAAVRPSADQRKNHRYEWRTRQFRAYNATVEDLIKFAFPLRDRHIQGAPGWMAEEKFDVAAEPDTAGLPSQEQVQTMLRKLLAERFGLRFTMVQQTFPVYALVRGSDDLTLTKGDPGLAMTGTISVKQEADGDTTIRFTSESMPELVGILMNFVEERQVVDETGLAGRFDFTMTVPTASLQSTDAGEKAAAFLRGVQPLGLRTVAKRAELPVMMVEQVARPTPN